MQSGSFSLLIHFFPSTSSPPPVFFLSGSATSFCRSFGPTFGLSNRDSHGFPFYPVPLGPLFFYFLLRSELRVGHAIVAKFVPVAEVLSGFVSLSLASFQGRLPPRTVNIFIPSLSFCFLLSFSALRFFFSSVRYCLNGGDSRCDPFPLPHLSYKPICTIHPALMGIGSFFTR